jgi:hypothetical protein
MAGFSSLVSHPAFNIAIPIAWLPARASATIAR